MSENFDSQIFDTPEFKSLERFIMIIHNQILTKLADNRVMDSTNMEHVYYQWLNYKGIRTGLKIWLNLIMFIKLFRKRKRFNRELIYVIQGVLEGLKLPLQWLNYRKKENRQTSETTRTEKVNNRIDPSRVVEALLKG